MESDRMKREGIERQRRFLQHARLELAVLPVVGPVIVTFNRRHDAMRAAFAPRCKTLEGKT